MKYLSPKEIEYLIIEMSAKDIPIEQIQFILEKEYGQEYDLDSLKVIQEKLKDKIKVQKDIYEREKSKKLDDFVLLMSDLIKELNELIEKLKKVDSLKADKTIVQAIQQSNNLIRTLLKSTGQIIEEQKAKINNYYIKITQINEYIEKNLPEIFESLSPEARKRLLKRLNGGHN